MAEETLQTQSADELVAEVADRFRNRNQHAIIAGKHIHELTTEYGLTLGDVQRRLRMNHGIDIKSTGTLSKWLTVYATYIVKWQLDLNEILHMEIGKLYLLRNVFEPTQKDMWFDRANTMSERELNAALGEATPEERKFYSVPLSVAARVDEARNAISEDATGKSDRVTVLQFMEIASELVMGITPEARRNMFLAMHGEHDKQE